jgi:RNA methyltransferase, TrmH family
MELAATFRGARRDPALVVLEGFHAVKHALRFGAEFVSVATVDVAEVALYSARLAPDVEERLVALCEEVPAELFAQLVPRPPHTGVVAIARRPDAMALRAGAPAVLLEQPQDLGNVGACVRVAAAAGAAGVVVTGRRDPWGPDAIRGSAGLHFALPVLHGEPPAGRRVIAFDPEGEPFDPTALGDDALLAFGTERDGLTDELKARAGQVVALPMQPGVSSLNLATSVAAALYAWRLAGGGGAA